MTEATHKQDRQRNDAVPVTVVENEVPVFAGGVAVVGRAMAGTQAGADPLGGTALDPGLAALLQRRRGAGRPLPQETAERMSDAFGADFASVRVHADTEADHIARSVQATAFSYGTDVYFSGGRYAPGTSGGDHLLAHELAHVLQPASGGSSAGPIIGRADDPAEADADRTANSVVQRLRRQATRVAAADRPSGGATLASLRRRPSTVAIRRHPGADVLKPGHQADAHASQDDKNAPHPKPLLGGLKPMPGGAKPGGAVAAKPATVFSALPPGIVHAATEAAAKLGINDAAKVDKAREFNHDEINCALVTISAIVGKQASAASEDVQARLAGRAGGEINSAIQSHNLWALQLLPKDVDPIAGLRLIEKINDPTFPEGNAYIVGPAQLNGMLKYLSAAMPHASGAPDPGGPALPGQPAPDTDWHLYQKGVPGDTMFPSSALIAAMEKYPVETRFAVFVFDEAFGGGTGGHWVYAERTASEVAFVDFQKNKASLSAKGNPQKAVETLGAFPFLNPKEQAKGRFSQGMFLAVAPPDVGKSLTFDPKVDLGAVQTNIADARLRLETLTKTRQIDDATPSALPAGMFKDDPQAIEIPSPKLVDEAVKAVTAALGLPGLKSRLGAEPDTWNIYVAGHPRISVTGVLSTPNLASRAALVGRAGEDPGKLASFTKGLEADELGGAVAKQLDLSAEAKSDYMWLNAGRFEFTDLIHEVIHTYEPQSKSFSTPMAEGLSEVFAYMVGQKLVELTTDAKFSYAYNDYYNPFRLRMENLIGMFSLAKIAKLYFDPATDLDTELGALFAEKNIPEDDRKTVKEQLTSPKLDAIDAALSTLAGGGVQTHDSTALDVAKEQSEAATKGTGDESLKKLYPQLSTAKGATYLTLSKVVGKMERERGAATGETPEEVRKRLAAPVEVTFEIRATAGGGDLPPKIFGTAGEMGGGAEERALPAREISKGVWQTAPIEFLNQRGKEIKFKLVNAKGEAPVDKEFTLPDRDTAKVVVRGFSVKVS